MEILFRQFSSATFDLCDTKKEVASRTRVLLTYSLWLYEEQRPLVINVVIHITRAGDELFRNELFLL